MIDNQRGFTLIEFLVAIVILMVGMLGMLQAINVAMDKNLENVLRTEAVMLADDRMMEYRSKAYSSVRVSTDSKSFDRDLRGIHKRYSTQEIITQPTTQSKQVDIRVSWRKKNTRYSHSLSSVISTY